MFSQRVRVRSEREYRLFEASHIQRRCQSRNHAVDLSEGTGILFGNFLAFLWYFCLPSYEELYLNLSNTLMRSAVTPMAVTSPPAPAP